MFFCAFNFVYWWVSIFVSSFLPFLFGFRSASRRKIIETCEKKNSWMFVDEFSKTYIFSLHPEASIFIPNSLLYYFSDNLFSNMFAISIKKYAKRLFSTTQTLLRRRNFWIFVAEWQKCAENLLTRKRVDAFR